MRCMLAVQDLQSRSLPKDDDAALQGIKGTNRPHRYLLETPGMAGNKVRLESHVKQVIRHAILK